MGGGGGGGGGVGLRDPARASFHARPRPGATPQLADAIKYTPANCRLP